MKKALLLIIICLSVPLLNGCLYPNEELAKNKIPPQAQLETVQKAIDSYQELTKGLLPIKTKSADTPIYEKYIIDFQPLKEKGLIDQIPGSAFENGGYYQYTLINVEKNPTVKVIDLRISEKLRTILARLETYRQIHTYPPFGSPISGDLYEIDFKKLKMKQAPTVVSPYSGKNLPIIMNTRGTLFVDYRTDFYEMIKKQPNKAKRSVDLRAMLAEDSPIVPAYSVRAKAIDGEPVYLE